jgi:RimJ/RimL family protein N-acetyltransferase
VLRRLGFQLEGHLREHKLIRGTYRDSLIWAKLSATPPRDGSQAGMAVVAQSAKEHG